MWTMTTAVIHRELLLHLRLKSLQFALICEFDLTILYSLSRFSEWRQRAYINSLKQL